MASIDKLERLITLTELLLAAERPVRVDEIRDRVPGYAENDVAFRRMFERDKDDLREMGIPIEVEPLPHADPPTVGYRLRRDRYFLRDPGLDPDELAALHVALHLVRFDGAAGTDALWAFGGAPMDEGSEEAEAPLASLPGDGRLPDVLDAIAERRTITFTYRSRHGEPRVRHVDPHRLEFQRGSWYLTGHDHERDAIRHFRIDRILDDQLVRSEPGAFEPVGSDVPPMPSEAWRYGEGEPVEAEVLVDAAYATLARQQVAPTTPILERPDGSVVLTVAYNEPSAFRGFVLGFLEHAEVLGPPDVRAAMVAWLDERAAGERS